MNKKERKKKVNQILNRGVVVDVLPSKEEFRERLMSTDPMRIYIGADPTSTSLHLSHAKNYMLLEEIRQLGHQVFVLFGDFTARIGDPTDKMATRDRLTAEKVQQNVDEWVEQIKPLMNFEAEENPPKVVFNSEWLSDLDFEDVIGLASEVTVQQMLDRDMFSRRMEAEEPIHLHEFMYPLMQGFDSVALDIDAELCGTDQTFNALIGRGLVKKELDKEKFVVTVNLMEDPKTGRLMSKSQGTGVFLDSDPFDMFGGVMSQSDEMTEIILVNNTRVPLDEIQEILAGHPLEAKKRAAFEVVKIFHGKSAAKQAKVKFEALVQGKDVDTQELPEVEVAQTNPSVFSIVRECLDSDTSNSQVRRLIDQGAVKVNGKKFEDQDREVKIPEDGVAVRVGKKRWFRVVE